MGFWGLRVLGQFSYRARWLLWLPHKQGLAVHSKRGIDKGLIQRGSTTDQCWPRCRSRKRPAPHTYIRPEGAIVHFEKVYGHVWPICTVIPEGRTSCSSCFRRRNEGLNIFIKHSKLKTSFASWNLCWWHWRRVCVSRWQERLYSSSVKDWSFLTFVTYRHSVTYEWFSKEVWIGYWIYWPCVHLQLHFTDQYHTQTSVLRLL
jgi:hypothetical protein